MEKKNNWVKAYIVDVLPCISVAFFVLAYVYLSAYYSVFKINIVQYTSFGDIFLVITEPLIIYALMVAILMSLIYDLYERILPRSLEKRNKKKKKNKKKNIKFLRFLVKIRKNSLLSFIFLLEGPRKKSREILKTVLYNVIMFFAYFRLFYIMLRDGYINSSLSSASIALIMPILFFFIFLFWDVFKRPDREMNLLRNLRKNSITWVVLLVEYYVYAASIFAHVGFVSANKMKEGKVKFEIHTPIQVFSNDSYLYVGHVSKKTFLQDKKTHEVVVLGDEGVVFSKLWEEDNANLYMIEGVENLIRQYDKYIMKLNNTFK